MFENKKLSFIVTSLCVISFLAAFDNIVISSNLPLVAAEYNGFGLYSWAQTAFLLTAATAQPLYGRYVHVLGRRLSFVMALASYIVGAALCGAAQSMLMLVVARALCGIGVGAFDSLMKIVIADHVPARYIGKYQAALGASWGLGYVVGALVGGAAVTHTNWRTVFWMALSIAVVALFLVLVSIKDAPRINRVRNDIIGMVLWFASAVLLILALSWGGTSFGWSSAVIVSLLCIGSALLVGFGVWERVGAAEPVIPRYVKNRSSLLILVSAFCYGGNFQSLMTYIPLYLSVIRLEDPMATNLELLSLVFVACVANVAVGLVIVRTGHYCWAIRASLGILTVASGLLQLLKPDSSRGLIVVLMLVTGVGVGGMLNSSIVTAQASVSLEHVPAVISLMTLCDLSGGITGITVQGTILSNTLYQRLASVDGVSAALVRQSSAYLWDLPESIRSEVIEAYMDAIHMSFWGSTAFAAVALLASLGLQSYTLRTEFSSTDDKRSATVDLESLDQIGNDASGNRTTSSLPLDKQLEGGAIVMTERV
ncbi:major facilitator superfamily domain-containing protein [Dichotomocladium elegans]|nr:major facilitator superfamily domain-containing protein [Dichotomocladium elegans]